MAVMGMSTYARVGVWPCPPAVAFVLQRRRPLNLEGSRFVGL
jgi:hypothetical protein